MQITWQQEGNSIEVGSASNYFDQADPCTQAWESGNKWENELTLTYYHDCQTNIWPYRDTKVCWAFVGKLIKPCKLWQQLRTWKCLYHPPKDSIAYVYTHIHTQTHTFSLSFSHTDSVSFTDHQAKTLRSWGFPVLALVNGDAFLLRSLPSCLVHGAQPSLEAHFLPQLLPPCLPTLASPCCDHKQEYICIQMNRNIVVYNFISLHTYINQNYEH